MFQKIITHEHPIKIKGSKQIIGEQHQPSDIMKRLIVSALVLLVSIDFSYGQLVPVYRSGFRAGGTGNDYADYIDIDPSGSLYITGRFDGTSNFATSGAPVSLTSQGSSDVFLARYTSGGALIWAISFGGTGLDRAYAVKTDANGNAYLIGTFNSTVDFDPGAGVASATATGTDGFIAKFTSSGNYVWHRVYNGANTETLESLVLDGLGNIYFTGQFSSPTLDIDPGAGILIVNNYSGGTTTFDILMSKMDTSGNFIWGYNLGGSSSDFGKSIIIDGSGNIALGGYFSNTMIADSAGSISLTSNGSTDAYIARYTPSGSHIWSASFGGTSGDILYSLASDANANLYATGTFLSVTDLDPGQDTTLVIPLGSTDIFVSKFNSSNTFEWGGAIGGTGSDISNHILVDPNGDVYTSGSFTDSADFNLGNTINSIRAIDGRDGYLAKYKSDGTYEWAFRMGSAGIDYARTAYIDPSNGEVWSTGYFNNTFYPDPATLLTQFSTAGLNDLYFARYGECSFPVVSAQPSNSAICLGSSATFSISAIAQNPTYQWQEGTNGGATWTNISSSGIYSNTTTPTLTISNAPASLNNLFYRCIISADCGLSTTSGVGILQVAPDTAITVNGPVLTAVQNGATYQWLDCNNSFTPVSGANGKNFTVFVPGSYAVAVTRNGCTDTSFCYTVTQVGLNTIGGNDQLTLHPNPVKDQLTVAIPSNAIYTITITDVGGRESGITSVTGYGELLIDVSSLPEGMYILHAATAQGIPLLYRFMKQ